MDGWMYVCMDVCMYGCMDLELVVFKGKLCFKQEYEQSTNANFKTKRESEIVQSAKLETKNIDAEIPPPLSFNIKKLKDFKIKGIRGGSIEKDRLTYLQSTFTEHSFIR